MSKSWKLITPLAYRRPRRPGRRIALIAGGLALSTVVAGLSVLGSIGPTRQAIPATRPRPSSSLTTTGADSTITPTSALTVPTGTQALAGYAWPRPPAATGAGGYPTPVLTPTTTTAASPPPPVTTSPSDTYTMTYDSGTVVIIYPGSAGDTGGYPGGDGRHHH